MKPSNFSTGDWFRLAGTEDYFQIEEVYKAVCLKGDRVMLGGRDNVRGYVFYYADEIEPIPINGEILEKNGFDRPDSSPTFSHSYGNSKEETAEGEILLSYDLTYNEWLGEFFGPWGCPLTLRIHYVHELQRIMWCLRLGPDIVL